MASVQPDEINLDDLNNNEEGASVSDSESGAGAVPGDNEGDGGAGEEGRMDGRTDIQAVLERVRTRTRAPGSRLP